MEQNESESHSVLSDYSPWDSPGQNTEICRLSLLWRIFPTQGWNPGLPHCRQILYHLSHRGSPRILERVAYLSPVDLTNPGMEPVSPVLPADSLPTELSVKRSESPERAHTYPQFISDKDVKVF